MTRINTKLNPADREQAKKAYEGYLQADCIRAKYGEHPLRGYDEAMKRARSYQTEWDIAGAADAELLMRRCVLAIEKTESNRDGQKMLYNYLCLKMKNGWTNEELNYLIRQKEKVYEHYVWLFQKS